MTWKTWLEYLVGQRLNDSQDNKMSVGNPALGSIYRTLFTFNMVNTAIFNIKQYEMLQIFRLRKLET